MPCALKKDGFNWRAAADSIVTIKVVADSTTLIAATYNGRDLPVQRNMASFKVEPGTAVLLLALSGSPGEIEVVELGGESDVCHLFGCQSDLSPVGFTIVGG